MEELRRRRRHRKRFRSWKRLKLILLVVGCTGLVLSAVPLALWLLAGQRPMRGWAAVYVACSLSALALRGLLTALDRLRKRKYRPMAPPRSAAARALPTEGS